MPRHPRLLRLAVVAALLGGGSAVGFLSLAQADSLLALTLSVPQVAYSVDEPLFLSVVVANAGPQDADVLRYLEPAAGVVALEITGPDDQPREYRPWAQLHHSRASLERGLIVLSPGSSFSAAVDVTYEKTDLGVHPVLSRPGEYVLVATYSVPQEWPGGPVALTSNEVHVSVSEPKGADLLAYQALYDCQLPYDLRPWNAAPAQASSYERVLSQYPDSAYAIYAKLYLGQIREGLGQEQLRGTEDGKNSLAKAATLYQAVSTEAGDTPLGVYAGRLAGRAFAEIGDVTRAQSLLERSFLSLAASDYDRLEALAWIDHVETGEFQRSGGVGGTAGAGHLLLPLRPFAQALGFTDEWNPERGTVSITGPGVSASLVPGSDRMLVNGVRRVGVRSGFDGEVIRVSPTVIATLMAERYGRGAANVLPRLIARAEPMEPRQP